MTTTFYRIRVRGTEATPLRREAFVCDRDLAYYGEWYTHAPGQAKSWKTRRGAEKWLAERPGVQGTVEAVTESEPYAFKRYQAAHKK